MPVGQLLVVETHQVQHRGLRRIHVPPK
jgi:hypothetical protein